MLVITLFVIDSSQLICSIHCVEIRTCLPGHQLRVSTIKVATRFDDQNCAVWISQTIPSKPIMYLVAELSKRREDLGSGKEIR
jgi:hypothetical protein